MYSRNIFSAFPIKEPTDLWVGDNHSVIEENKSNCTMCLASSDCRWELQSNLWVQHPVKNTLVLRKHQSWYFWGQEHCITGVLHSPCNVPGPATQRLYPQKEEKNSLSLSVLQCTETAGRSTTDWCCHGQSHPSHFLFAPFHSEDCPCWG